MIKKMMIQGMDKIMLDCEEATYLISKSDMENIGCVKKVQLKMHLMGCSLCRRFKVQSDIIDKSLKTLENIHMENDGSANLNEMPKENKEKLEKMITEFQ